MVEKIWGSEEWIVNNDKYCLKYLYVSPGRVCSNHSHRVKQEDFHVVAGSGFIRVGGDLRWVSVGDTVHVPVGVFHYFGTYDGLTLIEVSTHHSDWDVERRQESRTINDGDTEWFALWEANRD